MVDNVTGKTKGERSLIKMPGRLKEHIFFSFLFDFLN